MSDEFTIECPICPAKYTDSIWQNSLSSYCMQCGTELFNAINVHIPGASPKLRDGQLDYERDSDGEVVRSFTSDEIRAEIDRCRAIRSRGHPLSISMAAPAVDPAN